MTKSELIETILSRQSQLSAKDVELAVKTILEHMSQALSGGERIEIRGFGSFSCFNDILAFSSVDEGLLVHFYHPFCRLHPILILIHVLIVTLVQLWEFIMLHSWKWIIKMM